MQGLRARVGLVLDASGSMGRQYKSGRVQELLDRVLPLALHFDDDGSLDVWAFDTMPKPLDPALLDNIGDYINTVRGGWKKAFDDFVERRAGLSKAGQDGFWLYH